VSFSSSLTAIRRALRAPGCSASWPLSTIARSFGRGIPELRAAPLMETRRARSAAICPTAARSTSRGCVYRTATTAVRRSRTTEQGAPTRSRGLPSLCRRVSLGRVDAHGLPLPTETRVVPVSVRARSQIRSHAQPNTEPSHGSDRQHDPRHSPTQGPPARNPGSFLGCLAGVQAGTNQCNPNVRPDYCWIQSVFTKRPLNVGMFIGGGR
jgi:hypothetical protein